MAGNKTLPNRREEAILRILLHGELYGREIRNRYEQRVGQPLPLGSLYTTLDRMEEQGFIQSRLGDSAGERGGNRRKYFKIRGVGISALNELNGRFQALSNGTEGAVANG
jgi:PadR family transcriptional regulator, regulatory protein PadR